MCFFWGGGVPIHGETGTMRGARGSGGHCVAGGLAVETPMSAPQPQLTGCTQLRCRAQVADCMQIRYRARHVQGTMRELAGGGALRRAGRAVVQPSRYTATLWRGHGAGGGAGGRRSAAHTAYCMHAKNTGLLATRQPTPVPSCVPTTLSGPAVGFTSKKASWGAVTSLPWWCVCGVGVEVASR
jgi:hypothetical protein